jgi:ribonuclease P protein component
MASAPQTGRFSRDDRLLDGRDFSRVLRYGRRRSSSELVTVTLRRPEGNHIPVGDSATAEPNRCRLGLTTSRKAGNAVFRNRFRRRVRAWFRARRSELPPGTDLVVIARKPGTQLEFARLDAQLARMLGLAEKSGNETS